MHQPDLIALALAGSHARGAATPESDVDLVLITEQPTKYLEDHSWTGKLGIVRDLMLEDYGKVTSLRVFYDNGLEVEFGITEKKWIAQPLDPGTRKVFEDGILILIDKSGELSAIHREIKRVI